MNKIMVVVVTNGRKEYLEKTMASANISLNTTDTVIAERHIVDDSGDATYRQWLDTTYPEYTLHPVGEAPQGYAAAMTYIWHIIANADVDYVFHLEEDFVFPFSVPIDDLVGLLEDNPHLMQVVLKRQAWFSNEIKHGGVIEALEYRQGQLFDNKISPRGVPYTEHRTHWSFNPCVYRTSITEHPWPQGDWSESVFGKQLVTDPAVSFAFYQHREHPPMAIHIGRKRAGVSY